MCSSDLFIQSDGKQGSSHMKRRTLITAIGASTLTTISLAQSYPARPIKYICPWPAGGSTDVVMRSLAESASKALGQQVVVENKPGAGGLVGAGLVAKARPDGHTLLLVTGAYPSGAALSSQPGFDASKDIAMVSMITSYPFVLITAAKIGRAHV